MADIKSPKERSRNMSMIHGKDTKPEIYIRKKLFEKGFRYRKNAKYIIGHPDMWLSKYNTAVFVNGCYWHRHEGCKFAYMPKSRVDFWTAKFSENVKRDKLVHEELIKQGKRVLIIWECSIKNMRKSESGERYVLSEIERFLNSKELLLEI